MYCCSCEGVVWMKESRVIRELKRRHGSPPPDAGACKRASIDNDF